jgi:hypothetical protein
MVKNTKGGNRGKRVARKHMSSQSTKAVRYAVDEDERYAIVTQFYGNECDVMCTDGVIRRCVIRAKFKGRCKSDNYIKLGAWVLVGVRSWEVRRDGNQKCDLLAVYSDFDKDSLKQNVSCDFRALIKANEETTGVVEDEDVVFKDDKSKEYTMDAANGEKQSIDAGENYVVAEKSISRDDGDDYDFDVDEI